MTALSSPQVSVAMAVYNNAPFVAEAIESILNQTFGDFEFLIVDDGSTDGSGAIIDRYAAQDQRIRVLRQANAGFVASLNRLIAETTTPWIARMDGDDVALPDRLALQWAWMKDHPDHGVLGTGLQEIDEQGKPLPTDRPTPRTHEDFAARLAIGPLAHHNSVIMRKDLVMQAGGYRSAFRHCEDYDLWLRLYSITKMANLPDKLMQYRRYGGQVSAQYRAEQLVNAAVAYEAYQERSAGRVDPTASLATLPPLAQIDALFGRPVAKAIRARVAPALLYSESTLKGEGFDLILDAARDGVAMEGAWRTVARLVLMGQPTRAVRLAAALVRR